MKKLLSLLLIGALFIPFLCLIPQPVSAAEVLYSGSCGDDLTWTLDEDGLLTISGTGPMTDFSFGGAPWYSYRAEILSVIVSDGCTSLGDYAFTNFNVVTSIVLPDSLVIIGSYAFWCCYNLVSLNLPAGVVSLGARCFYMCRVLPSIDIPEGITSLPDYCLYGCYQITSLVIPAGVTTVGSYCFGSCSSLLSIRFLSSEPPALGSRVIYGSNTILETILVPDGSLDDYKAGEGWSSLTKYLWEVSSTPHFRSYPVSQYFVSSSSGSDSYSEIYAISNGSYCQYVGSYYASFLNGVDYSSTSVSTDDASPMDLTDALAPYDYVFGIRSLVSDALSITFTVDCSVTCSAASSYSGSYSFYLHFYDSSGSYLSSSSARGKPGSSSTSYKWPAGTTTFALSLTDYPEDAAYCVPVASVSTANYCTSISFSLSIEATYVPVVQPEAPVIITDLIQDMQYQYLQDYTGEELIVDAYSVDGGTISYQWYKCDISSGSAWSEISGATESSYVLPTDTLGSWRIRCVVTNTIGRLSVSVESNFVYLSVSWLEAPVLYFEIPSVAYTVDLNASLTLQSDAGLPETDRTEFLLYQWYQCDNHHGTGGVAIDGATLSSYRVDTSVAGAYYFYCLVTNEFCGRSVTVASNVATVYVGLSMGTDGQLNGTQILPPGLEFSFFTKLGTKVTATFSDLANTLASPATDVLSPFGQWAVGDYVGDQSLIEVLFESLLSLLVLSLLAKSLKSLFLGY